MTAALLKLAVVMTGGAAGAGLRFGLAELTHMVLGRAFPYGTLLVNLSGSLAIGYVLASLPPTGVPYLRLLLITGLLGGFTTYSAFAMETLSLVQAGFYWRAGLNVVLTLVLCFVAVWAGFVLGRSVHP